ncbi:hypothetical protein G3N58_20660 [Paraburkholderia sp. Ac-20342]|uniref:hypothetical protein n=1 Tax=Paraburkholderia sp. Ac-20342 TaxID=2703889 RepID=UPI00197F38B4|nr:hypothetical protein [Paraburkholderia sp. Ac-20342]MBN3849217.1 hypothetical protein [Paraburkholderia sp. Ac-20342]
MAKYGDGCCNGVATNPGRLGNKHGNEYCKTHGNTPGSDRGNDYGNTLGNDRGNKQRTKRSHRACSRPTLCNTITLFARQTAARYAMPQDATSPIASRAGSKQQQAVASNSKQ